MTKDEINRQIGFKVWVEFMQANQPINIVKYVDTRLWFERLRDSEELAKSKS